MSNNNNKNNTLEDLLKGDNNSDTVNDYDLEEYEDDYVYGDSDEIDDRYLEDTDNLNNNYANPREDKPLQWKYDDDSDEHDLENNTDTLENKPTLQERIESATNKTLDFVESKRFNTMQWVFSLGIVIALGIFIVVLMQASGNLESNVAHQEQEGVQFVAREVAPEEFTSMKEQEDVIKQQRDELEDSIEKNSKSYEEQVQELGELPEGYVTVQDEDGTVRYVSEEEANAWQEQEVRENTVAQTEEEEDTTDVLQGLDIEIMPASEATWHNNLFEPMDGTLDEMDLYQSRGQYIYFAQKALANIFANQILDADFDTNTYTLDITLNKDATFPLPDDFEERMYYTYQNSGYQVQAPDQLSITYKEMGVNEFLGNN